MLHLMKEIKVINTIYTKHLPLDGNVDKIPQHLITNKKIYNCLSAPMFTALRPDQYKGIVFVDTLNEIELYIHNVQGTKDRILSIDMSSLPKIVAGHGDLSQSLFW